MKAFNIMVISSLLVMASGSFLMQPSNKPEYLGQAAIGLTFFGCGLAGHTAALLIAKSEGKE